MNQAKLKFKPIEGIPARASIAQQLYKAQVTVEPPPVRLAPDTHYVSEYAERNHSVFTLGADLKPLRRVGAFNYEKVQKQSKERANK